MKYAPRPVIGSKGWCSAALGLRAPRGLAAAPDALTCTCVHSGMSQASGGVTGRSCLDGVLLSVDKAGGTRVVGTFAPCHPSSREMVVFKSFCRVQSIILFLNLSLVLSEFTCNILDVKVFRAFVVFR